MKTFYVAGRLIRQIGGDKRTLALMFLAPILIMFLLSTVLKSAPTKPTFDVINMPLALSDKLAEKANVTVQTDEETAIERIKSGDIDAYIVVDGTNQRLVIEGANPTMSELSIRIYSNFVSEYSKDAINTVITLAKVPVSMPQLSVERFYTNEDFEFFDYIAPLLMGFIVFFLVFLLSGISFLRERISGTMERLMATSIRRYHLVLGYFLGFGLFAIIQTVIIQSFLKWGLKISSLGSFFDVLVINILVASGSLLLGTLLSAFAKNEFQLFQFIPIVIIPQILFSGLFPLTEAPKWLYYLSKLFPLSYAADALRNVMLKDMGLSSCINDLLVLAGFSLLFLILNIFALKKYRKS